MKKIRLELEILFDVIQKEYYDPDQKVLFTDIREIDHDEEILELDEKIGNLYSSFYNFGSEYVGCELNYDYAKEHMQELENLIGQLKSKIIKVMNNEIIIEDNTQEEIQEIKNLVSKYKSINNLEKPLLEERK